MERASSSSCRGEGQTICVLLAHLVGEEDETLRAKLGEVAVGKAHGGETGAARGACACAASRSLGWLFGWLAPWRASSRGKLISDQPFPSSSSSRRAFLGRTRRKARRHELRSAVREREAHANCQHGDEHGDHETARIGARARVAARAHPPPQPHKRRLAARLSGCVEVLQEAIICMRAVEIRRHLVIVRRQARLGDEPAERADGGA